VADVDLGSARWRAFQAGAEPVTLRRGVERIERLAQGAADPVLRQLGAVLGPVGRRYSSSSAVQET
jgi:hypothetical protein